MPPPAKPAPERVEKLRSGKSGTSPPESAASLESAGSDKLLEQAAAAAATGRSQLGAAPAAGRPQADAVTLQHPGPKEQHKGKNAALRFLSGLRSKKDKYTAKERGRLVLQVGEWLGEGVGAGPPYCPARLPPALPWSD